MENDLPVADLEKDGTLRSSFDDDGIVTGSAEGEGDLSSGIRFRIDSGLRRLGEDGITAGTVKRSICQGDRGEDEAVFG